MSVTRTMRLEKQIVPYDEGGTPENEPLFVNHFQISHHQTDVFVDVGVIPIDDVLKAGMKPEGQATVRFLVLNRLIMSLSSLTVLRSQINEILEKAEATGFHVPPQTSTQTRNGTVSATGIPLEKRRAKNPR